MCFACARHQGVDRQVIKSIKRWFLGSISYWNLLIEAGISARRRVRILFSLPASGASHRMLAKISDGFKPDVPPPCDFV